MQWYKCLRHVFIVFVMQSMAYLLLHCCRHEQAALATGLVPTSYKAIDQPRKAHPPEAVAVGAEMHRHQRREVS